MSTDRDDLADLLGSLLVSQQKNQDWFPPSGGGWALCLDGWFDPKALAGAVLDAGLRPPARRIETPEELDALPDGTVILDANEEFHRLNPYGMSEPRTWFPAWLTGNAYATDFGQDPELPAVVLWEPEQEASE
ncbi:hypothetical protein [Nocardia sp. NPDC004260]